MGPSVNVYESSVVNKIPVEALCAGAGAGEVGAYATDCCLDKGCDPLGCMLAKGCARDWLLAKDCVHASGLLKSTLFVLVIPVR